MQEIQILQPNVNICHPPPCRACLSRRTVSKKIFFGWVILIIQLADEVQCYQDSIALWMHGLAARGGGNVFSLDRVSRGQRIQLRQVPTWRLFQLLSEDEPETVAFCEDKRMC